jgi:prepilin-type N-terminal cleavage/methylation domain-containing protein
MKSRNSRGFTLIEVLVVISLTAILTGILLGYNRESGKQLLLTRDQAKLVNLITRSKYLSTSTFLEGALPANPTDPKTCGYGVHVEKTSGEAFIFKEVALNCSSSDNRYSSGDVRLSGELNFVKLDSRVLQFAPTTTLNDVVFIPPDPLIVINGDKLVTEAVLAVETKDGLSKVLVKVNNAGRISTK